MALAKIYLIKVNLFFGGIGKWEPLTITCKDRLCCRKCARSRCHGWETWFQLSTLNKMPIKICHVPRTWKLKNVILIYGVLFLSVLSDFFLWQGVSYSCFHYTFGEDTFHCCVVDSHHQKTNQTRKNLQHMAKLEIYMEKYIFGKYVATVTHCCVD